MISDLWAAQLPRSVNVEEYKSKGIITCSLVRRDERMETIFKPHCINHKSYRRIAGQQTDAAYIGVRRSHDEER
jgi:hypothetical protein